MSTQRLILAFCAPLCLALGACSQGGAEASAHGQDGAAALAVETVQTRRGELVRHFSGTATLVAEREAQLVSELGGEVLQLLAEEGDRVAAGQVLARIDGERARLALAQSASIARRLDHEAERASQLLDKRMIAADVAERARYDRDAQRAAVDLAALSLSKREIRAPYAGVITRRHIKQGQWLAPNGLAFEIADFGDLVAELPVPEKELAGLVAGQPVTIHADAFPEGAFIGSVERIGAVVDAKSGTANVRIDVEEADTPLRPGQFVRIAIERERIADALLIPKAAVLMDAGQTEVFVVREDRARRQPVRLAAEQEGWVQVLDGLAEGDAVIRLGQAALSDGDAVAVIQPATAKPLAALAHSTP